MTALTTIARQLWDQGFNPLPTNGKDKWPGYEGVKLSWRDYASVRVPSDRLLDLFAAADGIGLLCGKTNPEDPLGLEVIDVDTKNDPEGTIWQEMSEAIRSALPGVWAKLSQCIVRTPSGGYHLHYLCSEVGPKQVGARRAIEVLGQSNFCVFPPTPGYTIEGGSELVFNELSPDERAALHSIIRSMRRDEDLSDRPTLAPHAPQGDTTTPWERFNQDNDGQSILLRHGWRRVYHRGDRVYYRRPGDTTAATSGNWDLRRRLFYCFSTSTPLPHDKGLTSYALFVHLEHGGDWSAAAKAVAATYRQDRLPSPVVATQPIISGDPGEGDDLSRYLITSESDIPRPVPVVSIGGATISTAGNITTIGGQAKSGKTALFSAWLAGAVTTTPGAVDTLGATVVPAAPGQTVLHIDTEQSRYDHKRTLMTIVQRAGLTSHPSCLKSYNVRGLDPEDQRKVVEQALGTVDLIAGVHSIWIDGPGDMVSDVNDAEESSALIRWMESMAVAYNCPLFAILHHNAGQESEKGRGHLGSGLERKSESVISVVKQRDTDISEVKGYRLRNAGRLPSVAFTWSDELHYHVTIDGPERKVSVREQAYAARVAMVYDRFRATPRGIRRTDVVALIMEVEGCSTRTAQTRVTEMINNGSLGVSKGGFPTLELIGSNII